MGHPIRNVFIFTQTLICTLIYTKGCWHPFIKKCNIIIINFICANSSKCNLEFSQHFVASRDLELFNFFQAKYQTSIQFEFVSIFKIKEYIFWYYMMHQSMDLFQIRFGKKKKFLNPKKKKKKKKKKS